MIMTVALASNSQPHENITVHEKTLPVASDLCYIMQLLAINGVHYQFLLHVLNYMIVVYDVPMRDTICHVRRDHFTP